MYRRGGAGRQCHPQLVSDALPATDSREHSMVDDNLSLKVVLSMVPPAPDGLGGRRVSIGSIVGSIIGQPIV